jgi:hypothetical protein
MGTLLDIFRNGGIMNKTGMKGVSFTSPKVMPEQPEQPQQPVVDSSNAMGSLAGLLGPSPAEREAQIRKAQEGKAKMAAWTGLFDGLRHLGNLYYTAKGAAPQQFTDPMQQVDAQYQEQMKLADQIANYNRQYAQTQYALQRQAEQDELNKELKKAQASWYYGRDDATRQKAERDKYQIVRMPNGSLMRVDKENGTAEEVSPSDPLYEQLTRSRIGAYNRQGTGGTRANGGKGASTYGYTTTRHIDPTTGDIVTTRVPTTPNQPTGKQNTSTTVTKPKPKPQSKPQAAARNNGNKKKVTGVNWKTKK